MNIFRRFSRLIAMPMAALMLALSMPLGAAQAALVGTESLVAPSQAEADRALVSAFMAREDVRSELNRMGVNPDEAAARVAVLSDAEIRGVAARIEAAPAGQNIAGVLIGAAILVVVVLMITDLLGYTDIFPFIKPAK